MARRKGIDHESTELISQRAAAFMVRSSWRVKKVKLADGLEVYHLHVGTRVTLI